MFDFFRKNRELAELKKLDNALYAVKKPLLSAVEKRDLKLRLFRGIRESRRAEVMPSSLRALGFKIHRLASAVKVPAWMVFSMRERIMAVIEDRSFNAFDNNWFRPANLLRTAISSVLLFVFVVTSIFIFPFRVPTGYARLTYMDEVNGQVFVLRDGEFLQAKVSFAIREGDVIFTREGSSASVHFFDDSLSRMSENTNLEIKRLYAEPLNPVITDVELYLLEGRLWNKVVNLTDDDAVFTVRANKVQAIVSRKAAFDMSVEEGQTTIAVFDNVVNLKRVDSLDNGSKTVVAGFRAEVSAAPDAEIKLEEMAGPEGKKWVADNLQSDEEYDRKLNDEKEKMLSADPAASAAAAADGVNGNEVVKTSSRADEAKGLFMAAYGKLLKAEIMLVRGYKMEGSRYLKEFKTDTARVMADIRKLMKEDEFNAGLLQSLVDEKISGQIKDLAAFLPGDALYPAKEMVHEVELMAAGSEIKGVQIKLSQAQGKLLELQELIKKNDYEAAMKVFRDYKFMNVKFNIRIDQSNLPELKDSLVNIVQGQIQQIKVLTAVEQTLVEQQKVEYRDEIELVRQKMLNKLVDSLDKLQDSLPEEVIYELKDLFESYLLYKTEDARFIIPVLDGLVSRNKGLSFIMPGESAIPDGIGVVVIEEKDSTPEAAAAVKKWQEVPMPKKAGQGLFQGRR